jgi:RNA polymerase sigma factor (TIGR02999 family)
MDDSPTVRARVTGVLLTAESGEAVSLDALVDLLYGELREMAHRQLARERDGHTLQTTALVHEAWFRLAGGSNVGRRGRSYFFAAAARAMRQVLVDHARRRGAVRRGQGAVPVPLDNVQLAAVDSFAAELIDLDKALERLAKLEPRHAQVVECRYFGGLSVEETAEALGVSPRTVKSDWALARAWLYDAIGGRDDD